MLSRFPRILPKQLDRKTLVRCRRCEPDRKNAIFIHSFFLNDLKWRLFIDDEMNLPECGEFSLPIVFESENISAFTA